MGSPRVSPPRAPECPFSGLSLAMSCPTLPLGLRFLSPSVKLSCGHTRGPSPSLCPQGQWLGSAYFQG